MNTTGDLKHEWYQNDNQVIVGVLFKKAVKENVHVETLPRELTVTIKLDASREQQLVLPLFEEIDPSKSSYEVLSTRIEVKLHKKVPGRWTALEPTEQVEFKVEYPTSSKKKADWTAVEKSIEEDKPEGEQALQKLFQDIFKNGTDETRRAMMKSFTESNGTALSTNWDEVGKKKVPITPPDGMVPKEFEK